MSIRRWPLLLLGVLAGVSTLFASASCGRPTTAAEGRAAASSAPAQAVSFADFLAQVRTAGYADYAGKPGTNVDGEHAFNEMRQFLLDRYGNVHVAGSHLADDAVFDCIQSDRQSTTAPTPALPPPTTTQPPSGAETGIGASAPSSCPAGTAPVRRMTLEQLVHFKNLQSYLSKGPGGTGGAPPIGTSTP
jgi:hypothetical protein